MTEQTITVGIPTKNVSPTIHETLRMLDEQTRRPDRVLIADDSIDSTADICRAHASRVGYELDVFHAPGGVGAAREAIRERAALGLLLCLDAEVKVRPDWVEQHAAIHAEHERPAVVSGPWPGIDIVGTQPVIDPSKPEYFVEANCSLYTTTAETIGGWDPRFQRGCDWDFRYRLARTGSVDAVCSDRVAAQPMDSNSGGWLHIKKQLNRPSSIPYLRKYGREYALFHPLHVAGDIAGISALALVMALPLVPIPAAGALLAGMGLYSSIQRRPGDGFLDRILRGLGLFAVGYSTVRVAAGGGS